MTNQEYEALYTAARKRWPYLTREEMRKIKQAYEEAGQSVAAAVARAKMRDLSSLTVDSLTSIQMRLTAGAKIIEESITERAPELINVAYTESSGIERKYILDVIFAGHVQAKITTVGVESLVVSVNNKLNAALHSRIWADGYTFSARVVRAGEDYQMQIKRVIAAGIAQGRDPVKIAKDIEVYIDKGGDAMFAAKRYGELQAGTKRWKARISQNVDYRALRIVRSELVASQQLAGGFNGVINPVSLQLWDWIRINTQQHDCACPSLAANGPYTYDKIPGYPHPNCECIVRQRLQSQRNFIPRLYSWGHGGEDPAIQQWYSEVYLKF